MRLLSLARSFENVDMYSKVRCIVEVALHYKECMCVLEKQKKQQQRMQCGPKHIKKLYKKTKRGFNIEEITTK